MMPCPLCTGLTLRDHGTTWCVVHGTVHWPPLTNDSIAALRAEAEALQERKTRQGGVGGRKVGR